MVIYGHGSLEDTPWIIANKMWSFLNKVEGVKSAQSDRDDIGSRIRIVSSFIRQQVERGSQRDRDCRHVSPTLDFFSRSAETWCIQHAGKSIGGRNWSKLRMLGACFDESCLHHCDFHGCRLVAATFKGAKLEGVNFDNAVMDGIAMEQARLVNCSFAGTRLREANLDGADLRGSSLSNVDLNQASLIGANLAGAKLTKTPLSSAKMQRCNMAESRCDGLRAYHADFRQADLAGASLTKAELYGGKFDGANLARCDLSGAEVENCCFLGVSGLTTSQVRSTQGWEFALFDEELLKELGLAEATAVELNNPAFRKKIGLEAHKPKLGEQMINYQMRMNSVRKAHGLQSVVVSEKTIWPSLLDFSGRD
jgi:uncharacterized protein YjbI with pentapeptide repeats